MLDHDTPARPGWNPAADCGFVGAMGRTLNQQRGFALLYARDLRSSRTRQIACPLSGNVLMKNPCNRPAGKLDLLVIQPTPFCNLDCDYCYLPNRRSKERIQPHDLEGVAVEGKRQRQELASMLDDGKFLGNEITFKNALKKPAQNDHP
jgi:hypothetical protein